MSRARDVADIQDNLGGVITPFVAGKNKFINGDFNVWQRGTTFTGIASGVYTADRFQTAHDGTGTATVSRQTFTPGSAPVAGYESAFFLRHQIASSGSSGFFQMAQSIEDVRTLAGQTVTVSFWAKADTTRSMVYYLEQLFGSGGSSSVLATYTAFNITTSWARYSVTFNIPSIAGKTIGTNSMLYNGFRQGTTTAGAQLDIWGVQIESGSVATPFTTATGTIQGELAACQRYYIRQGGELAFQMLGWGQAFSTTSITASVSLPVPMRVKPTSVDYSTLRWTNQSTGAAITAVALDANLNSSYQPTINCTTTSVTANLMYSIGANNSTSAYLGFSAEL